MHNRDDLTDESASIIDARGPEPSRPPDPGVELDVDGNHAVTWLAGDIDAVNADHVTELGALAVAEPRVDELVVDLSRVTFLGSSGLGSLIRLKDHCVAAEKRFALRGVPERVRRLLVLTKLDDAFGLPAGDTGRC